MNTLIQDTKNRTRAVRLARAALKRAKHNQAYQLKDRRLSK